MEILTSKNSIFENGYGSGYGNGYGSGNGNGDGSGNGNGYGNGYGSGNGHGNGDVGIKSINGNTIHIIDNIPTVIISEKRGIVKGFILQNDLSLTPCYIAKNDYFYAHGDTIKSALEALQNKTDLNLPIPQRVANFRNQFKDFNVKIEALLLYNWHFNLTGSCKTGRDVFCTDNNINLKTDKFTVYEFIELTKNAYNGNIIKQLLDN